MGSYAGSKQFGRWHQEEKVSGGRGEDMGKLG